MSQVTTCYRCRCLGTISELRPYGPRGEWVCFDCAFATPADKAATERQFGAQLDAAISAGSGIAIVGGEEGPYPYTPEALLAAAQEGKKP